jgi:hypothetical protein
MYAIVASKPGYAAGRARWDHPSVRSRLIDGDTELLPGLTLLETGRHAPGRQSVLLRLGLALKDGKTTLLTVWCSAKPENGPQFACHHWIRATTTRFGSGVMSSRRSSAFILAVGGSSHRCFLRGYHRSPLYALSIGPADSRIQDPEVTIGPNSSARGANQRTLLCTHFVQLVLIRSRPPSFAYVELLACRRLPESGKTAGRPSGPPDSGPMRKTTRISFRSISTRLTSVRMMGRLVSHST